MESKSLKNLWQAVANFRRDQREERNRQERRRESRLPAHGLARIYWQVEEKGRRSETVNLLGISEHGCSFRTDEALAPDQKIFVDSADEAFAPLEALVRHVEPDGHAYIVGAEIISRDGTPLERTKETQPAVTEPTDSEAESPVRPVGRGI